MKLPDQSRFPAPENSWLPGVTRKAQTIDEFMSWAKCAEMRSVFDKLAVDAVHMKEYLGSEELSGKRCLWLLLAVESVCRQESSVRLEPNNEAEMVEGVEIVSEMMLAAAGACGKPEPLKSQDFWRDFIFALCMAWGGPATMLELDPHHLYAVQIRRLRDSLSG